MAEKRPERTNEEKLDLFADLLEPVAEILADQEVTDGLRGNGKKVGAIRTAIKNHKGAVIEILARLEDTPVDEYKVNMFTLPLKLADLINRPEVQYLFTSQDQKKDGAVSGLAMENTEDGVR